MLKLPIRLRSDIQLKFEADGTLHNQSFNKKHPLAIQSALRELMQMAYLHYGESETDEFIKKSVHEIKNKFKGETPEAA